MRSQHTLDRMGENNVNVVRVELQDGMRFEARDARGATALMDSAPPDVDIAGMTPMEYRRQRSW